MFEHIVLRWAIGPKQASRTCAKGAAVPRGGRGPAEVVAVALRNAQGIVAWRGDRAARGAARGARGGALGGAGAQRSVCTLS